MKKLIFLTLIFIIAPMAMACTSAIVSGRVTASGRPMIWKHRDTGTEHNFVARVEPNVDSHGFVALFNGGDSLLSEAWMGMNDAGFAIMNTASYNLMPDTAKLKDREGIVMRRALEQCATLADFEALLGYMEKPLGVQANFGVMDASGDAAYYETDDYGFKKFSLADKPSGVIYRTNYSYSGQPDSGYGYIREANARHMLSPHINNADVTPETFTEEISRSYYHSLIGRDFAEGPDEWIVDQDFIPRKTSSASIVIEGLLPGETPDMMTMWTVIGYPPVSHVSPVTIDSVPEALQPTADGYRSTLCNEALQRKHQVFSITRGNGQHYLNIKKVNEFSPAEKAKSKDAYKARRNELKKLTK